ncbi:hypothetical protein P8452_13566 [Trifolium repens]|nr:hypothetical protein P8452_13566 [Trifolium repens]
MKAVDEKLKMIERLMVVIPVMVSVLFCWDAKLNLKVRCFVHECSLIYLIWSSGFGGGFITICISCLRYSFGAYLSRNNSVTLKR